MGFCIFWNAAMSSDKPQSVYATLYALEIGQIKRVKILEWYVHQGNETQAAVENVPNITFVQFINYQAINTHKNLKNMHKSSQKCATATGTSSKFLIFTTAVIVVLLYNSCM